MKDDIKPYIIQAFIILVSSLFLLRVAYMQLWDEDYKLKGGRSTVKEIDLQAYRGLIYDRKGRPLVVNSPIYDLKVIASRVEEFDTTKFCQLLNIDKEYVKNKLTELKSSIYSRRKEITFLSQIKAEDYYRISDVFRFKGFEFYPRTIRSYPHQSLATTLGPIAEISADEMKKDSIENYYMKGDFIGKLGLEKIYEKHLRGTRGKEFKLKNKLGNVKGSFANGELDIHPIPGKSLQTTIDLVLQQYGEKLMAGKVGSIVALEPSTGEILSIVSSPSYDPNLLTGKDYSKNYSAIYRDSLRPLFDRATGGQYPPGSIFKLVQALIALQNGVITTTSTIYCDGTLVGDHAPPGTYDVHRGIKLSSNNYFYRLFYRMLLQNKSKNKYEDTEIGYIKWRKDLLTFGLGRKLGSDVVQYEKGGYIPTDAEYDKIFGGDDRYYVTGIQSNAIGQGELLVVPMQMANIAAIIANRGYYFIPHCVKAIGDSLLPEYHTKHRTMADSIHFPVVIDAMREVVTSGTATRANSPKVEICGKTGTAENPHGEDHSVFIAFAPKDNPKIAIAVYVENAGYGGTWAAPIARHMIEMYLFGEVSEPYREQRLLEKRFY